MISWLHFFGELLEDSGSFLHLFFTCRVLERLWPRTTFTFMSWIFFYFEMYLCWELFMSWSHFMVDDMDIIEVYMIFRCDVLCWDISCMFTWWIIRCGSMWLVNREELVEGNLLRLSVVGFRSAIFPRKYGNSNWKRDWILLLFININLF